MGVRAEARKVEEQLSPSAVGRSSGDAAPPGLGQDPLSSRGRVLLDHGPAEDAGEGGGLQDRLRGMLSAGARILVRVLSASFPSRVRCLTSLSTAVQLPPFHPGWWCTQHFHADYLAPKRFVSYSLVLKECRRLSSF